MNVWNFAHHDSSMCHVSYSNFFDPPGELIGFINAIHLTGGLVFLTFDFEPQ
jgi:hypothetical protein